MEPGVADYLGESRKTAWRRCLRLGAEGGARFVEGQGKQSLPAEALRRE